jgi:hypothetical protein
MLVSSRYLDMLEKYIAEYLNVTVGALPGYMRLVYMRYLRMALQFFKGKVAWGDDKESKMSDTTNPQQSIPRNGIQIAQEPMDDDYRPVANDGMVSPWGAKQVDEINPGHRRHKNSMLKYIRFWAGFAIGTLVMFLAILALAEIPTRGPKMSDGTQIFRAISKSCRLPDDSSSTMAIGDDGKSSVMMTRVLPTR